MPGIDDNDHRSWLAVGSPEAWQWKNVDWIGYWRAAGFRSLLLCHWVKPPNISSSCTAPWLNLCNSTRGWVGKKGRKLILFLTKLTIMFPFYSPVILQHKQICNQVKCYLRSWPLSGILIPAPLHCCDHLLTFVWLVIRDLFHTWPFTCITGSYMFIQIRTHLKNMTSQNKMWLLARIV